MSIHALIACFSFYSAVYLIYRFFAVQPQPLYLIFAVILFICSWLVVPSHNSRKRRNYDQTMQMGWYSMLFDPLIFWWRLFMFPIRFVFRFWLHD